MLQKKDLIVMPFGLDLNGNGTVKNHCIHVPGYWLRATRKHQHWKRAIVMVFGCT
jgi:hypothetical protein